MQLQILEIVWDGMTYGNLKTMNRKRELAFSIIFMILSYYIVTQTSFLTFGDYGDLFLFVMLIIGSLNIVVLSAIELIKFKHIDIKNKIINFFCFISSLIFLLASAYAIILK